MKNVMSATTKAFEDKLIREYGRAEETLVNKFSAPLTKQGAKGAIDSTLLATSAMQTELILSEIPGEYVAGIYLESDLISSRIPVYVGFDFNAASTTGINKLTKDTIGHIGNFNEEMANELKLRYGNLVDNNELVTQLDKHGWTAHTENRMVKMGFDKETINLVKHQTTTNKMLQILEQQGIRGNIPPNEVAKHLIPHIKGVFGAEGVTMDNIGGVRRVLSVDADGKYKWVNKKVTRAFHTTAKNYADIIARSTIVDANRLARHETLQQSGFVKEYRSIAVMDMRTGHYDAMMHGQIVKMGDGPPYHAMCRCEYEPVWKKSTGLTNRPDSFYNDKRDKWFWKQHQLKEYNLTLPKGGKIPNANFLPKNALKGMPGKEGMRAIRAKMLKLPVPKSEDMQIADDLWGASAIDGKEHAVITTMGKSTHFKGVKHSVKFNATDIPVTPFKLHHTHPSWDSPLSGGDLKVFLRHPGNTEMVAITKKSVYKAVRTPQTKGFKKSSEEINFENKFKKATDKCFTRNLDQGGVPDKIWRDSLVEVGQGVADKYGFKYIVTPRT